MCILDANGAIMKKLDRSRFPGLAGLPTPVEADPDLYHRIGMRIAKSRNSKRMTQDELGILISESALSISRWENASRKPNVEDLEKLARALEVSILFFTQEDDAVEEDALYLLNRAAGELDELDREELLQIAKIKLDRQRKIIVAQQLRQQEEKSGTTALDSLNGT